MLVVSGSEFGGTSEAASGQLPQAIDPILIGRIQAATGYGRITHASGMAGHVAVGDPVFQGDVIETLANGLIEIRFLDGTVFNLSGDTRIVLSEFARDSKGTLRSALLAVTRGAFAFVAGSLAKTGSLTMDTPLGRIRSRTETGGIGMLSLAALTFALTKQAQAADPNVTFLDDDSITYKDLKHGSFELTTKEAIPRHIIVEDPGETVVLSKRGSSVSVNQVANTPARMEELLTAQQDVLANYAKGLSPNGSSTPPFLSPGQLLQPINFVQPDATHAPGSLPQLEFPVFTTPEVFFVPQPTLAITRIDGQIAIAGNDIINAAKADAGVDIAGGTSGVENGRIVTITIVDGSNHVVYASTATVADGGWLVNVSPTQAKALADGIYTVTAEVSNAAGVPAQASQTVRVDETPPAIAIGPIADNNVVNVHAAGTGFAITGTVFDAENGQPVTVRIVDSAGHVVDTFATTLQNATWSVDVSSALAKSLHDGSYTVTADVSDTAGNPAPEATLGITVDETPPTVTWSPPAESGVEGTPITLGAITATTNSLPGHVNGVQSLVVSGIPAGAVLTDGTNSFTATSGDTAIDVKSWNLSSLKITPPNDSNFILTVTATDQDANISSTTELITVVPLAPGLNPVTALGSEDTAIALNLGVDVRSLLGANGDASPNSLATLVLSGIPVGATLSDGTGLPGHSFTATAGNTAFDVASLSLSSLKITPAAEFEGSFTLTIAATERDAEGNVSATVTASEVVMVVPVAEQPAASLPATLSLAENTVGAAVAGVSVGPPAEDANDTVSATLTVSHGTLHVASLAGVTVAGDDSATLTLSGSATAVNSLLAGLTYTPTQEYEGADTLQLSVTSSDGANTNPTTATASTAITVNPVAEPPAANAPATLTLDENATGIAVGGVSVGPQAEDGNDTVSATLTVSHGTLHVASLTGVTVAGDDSGTLTLSGSAAAVNSLLAGLTYTPTTEYEGGDTLQISVTSSDGTNTNPATANASTAITVNSVAEPPAASAPATLTLSENVIGATVGGVSVGPPAEDTNDTVSATLTVAHGALNVGSLSDVTVTGEGSATLTLSGSAAAVNSLLAGLTYTPTAEYEGADALHLSVTSSDGANTSPATATATTVITVHPVAEPPTASAPATLTVDVDDDDDDDVTIVAVTGVRVGPLAEDGDDRVSATLTVSHGTLHVASLSGVTVTGDGSATLTLSGNAAAVNGLLASLTYSPTAGFEGSDALHLSVKSLDGTTAYPTQATAVTTITVAPDSESLIVGGPGPTLSWNDAANWSDHVVPTLGIDVTVNAPSNYTALITGAPVAQAASLTIPHGAATTEIAVGGTLQLAGDLTVSDAGKLDNNGTLEATTSASFIGPITNAGTIIVDAKVDLDVAGTIVGSGKVWIDSGATLEFAFGSKVAPGTTDSQLIYFEQGAGKLIIDDWGKFAGVITGTGIGTHLTSTDLIDLTQLPFVGGSMSVSISYNSGTNVSTIVFRDGVSANNVTLHFSGDYTGTTWSFASIDGGAGTEVIDPPAGSGTVTSSVTAGNATAAVATTNLVTSSTGTTSTGAVATASQTVTSSPARSAGGSAAVPTTAGVWASAPDISSATNTPNGADVLSDVITGLLGVALLADASDSLVSSSAASSPAHFDTIPDVAPGTDKIDLTAFGSLAHDLVALTPTSSSVPAHTIAYDTKANQTIVYVNPTGHALGLGDSGLVEIHLPVASVHPSEFMHAAATAPAATAVAAVGGPVDLSATTQSEATAVTAPPAVDASDTTTVTAITADVSSDAGASNDPHAVALSSAAQTAGTGSGAPATGNGVDDAAITPASGPSAELPHVTMAALMPDGFVFDDKPAFDSAGTPAIHHDAASVSGGDHAIAGDTGEHAPSVLGASAHALEPSSISMAQTATAETDDPGHSFHFKDDIGSSGSGATDVVARGDDPAPTGRHQDAAGFQGPLVNSDEGAAPAALGDAFHFKHEISSFKNLDATNLAALEQALVSTVHHDDAAQTDTPLAPPDGPHAIDLPPPDQHADHHFSLAGIAPHHGALVTGALATHVAHDLIV